MPEQWLQVHVDVARDRVPAAEAALEELGALVTWNEAAGSEEILEPEPGAAPLWADVRVTALLPVDTPRARVAATLAAALGPGLPDPACSIVLDRDWDAEWRRQLKPLRFGARLWVCPVGQACPDPAGISLLLEPGLAFGTGTHATTAMCLTWLGDLPLADATVLDYGCGSGILAIAALALGARSAAGVDIDPQALTASRDNALRNGCADRLALGGPEFLGASPAAGPYDVLVANILSGPLVRLAPEFRRHVRPGTRVALSGILAGQAEEVIAAFGPWVPLQRLAEQGGWVLLVGDVAGTVT